VIRYYLFGRVDRVGVRDLWPY